MEIDEIKKIFNALKNNNSSCQKNKKLIVSGASKNETEKLKVTKTRATKRVLKCNSSAVKTLEKQDFTVFGINDFLPNDLFLTSDEKNSAKNEKNSRYIKIKNLLKNTRNMEMLTRKYRNKNSVFMKQLNHKQNYIQKVGFLQDHNILSVQMSYIGLSNI